MAQFFVANLRYNSVGVIYVMAWYRIYSMFVYIRINDTSTIVFFLKMIIVFSYPWNINLLSKYIQNSFKKSDMHKKSLTVVHNAFEIIIIYLKCIS